MFFSRGIGKWCARLSTIFRRYGWTPHQQITVLESYAETLKRLEIRGTFFIPAIVLKRHHGHLKGLLGTAAEVGGVGEAVEWGIHGYVHSDHAAMPPDKQRREIRRAIQTFDACGVPFVGFRSPYLKHNADTYQALGESGRMLFDSSACVFWENAYASAASAGRHAEWTRAFYAPRLWAPGASLPRREGLVLELPVSLPDDDTLLDRDRLSAAAIADIWIRMLEVCHRENEIFVLQLHPERFPEVRDALEALVARARRMSPPVWIAPLSEAARRALESRAGSGAERKSDTIGWQAPVGYRGTLCVSGDIDTLTIGDFFMRILQW